MIKRAIILIGIIVFLVGCGDTLRTYNSISLKDLKFSIYADMYTIDRASLGLSPLPDIAREVVVEINPKGIPYDTMLHIYDKTSRTIAFKKSEATYKWIGEQETTYGTMQYTNIDGTFTENIVISYETQKVSGYPTNKVNVIYFGDRSDLLSKGNDITLSDVEAYLTSWHDLDKWWK